MVDKPIPRTVPNDPATQPQKAWARKKGSPRPAYTYRGARRNAMKRSNLKVDK